MSRQVALIALAGLVLAVSTEANARFNYPARVPNGTVISCGLCHFNPGGGGPRNAFGQDVEANLNGGPDWSAVFDLDSDGDGYTNGEELGDAFGVWRRGDPNPVLNSRPDDQFDTPNLVGNAPIALDATITLAEDGQFEGTLSASDADADDLRFRLMNVPTLGTVEMVDEQTGAFSYTPDPDVFGADSFNFQVFDGNNISANPGVITINITAVNDTPEIVTDGDQTVDEDETVVVVASGEDVEDGTLLVDVDPLPDGAVWDVEEQRFVWTPDFFQAGVYELEFSVTDSGNVTVAETVTITVNNVNRRPDAEDVEGPEQGDEGTEYRFSVEAIDPDLEPLTFSWSFGNGDTAQTDVSEVDYTWPSDGTFTVRVIVSDGDLAATRTHQIVIDNVAPVVTAGPDLTIDEGDIITLQGSVFDPGEGDEHDITWDFGDGGTSDEVQPEYAYGDDGTFVATLTADDGEDTGTDSAIITVNNVAPLVDAGGDITLDEGARHIFDETFSDPGFDDVLTVNWDYGDGVQDTEGIHTYRDQGSFSVSLTVSDDDGGTTEDVVTATVLNVAPSFLGNPPLFAPRGRTYLYNVEPFDPGDDTVAIELLTGPEGMTLEGDTVTYTPDPEEEEVEAFTVSIRISDEDGGENTQTYTLTVGLQDRDGDGAPDECEDMYDELDGDDPNDGELDLDADGITNREECIEGTSPIESNAPTAPSISQPADGSVITFQRPELIANNGLDPDDDPLTYTFELYGDRELNDLVEIFEDVSETPNRTRVTVGALFFENQSYYWRVRASDGRGLSPYSEVARFTFSQVNDPPTVPVPVAPEGTVNAPPLFEALQAEDPEGQRLSYDFQVFFDLPENQDLHSGAIAVIAPVGPSVTWMSPEPFEENVSYTWRIRAVDPNNGRSEYSEPISFLFNAENAVPPTPVIVSPEDGVTLEGPAELVFVATVGGEDEDLDEVTHSFRIATEPGFAGASIVREESGLLATPDGEVTWDLTRVDVGLVENENYYWDVRAFDGTVHSPSTSATFLYSTVNEAPPAPTALSPAAGESLTNPGPEFVWSNVSDPEGHAVLYNIEVYRDAPLSDLAKKLINIDGDEGEQTSKVLGELDNNQMYYWRVQGVDELGEEGAWSGVADFVIALGGQPPTQPGLIGPIEGETFEFSEEITLVWSNSTDPEGDPITYTAEVLNADDQLITSVDADESTDGSQTSVVIGVNLAAGEYTWRVLAEAGDQRSPYSESGAFVVNASSSGGGGGGCSMVASDSTGAGTLVWVFVVVLVLRRRNLP